MARLDAIRQAGPSDPQLVDMNRAFYSARQDRAHGASTGSTRRWRTRRATRWPKQRSELIDAQRQAVIALWQAGTITDQTLADAEREIDLEDLMFDARREGTK